MNFQQSTHDTNQYYPTPDALIEKMLMPDSHIKVWSEEDKDYIIYSYDEWRELSDEEKSELKFHSLKFNANNHTKILEPSAGSGNILKYIHRSNDRYSPQFFACEIEPHLQQELMDCTYTTENYGQNTNRVNIKLVGDDFLKYKSDTIYDYIIMNPPFNQGVKHLLHAFHISQGAKIICILNAESIKNPYTEERKLLAKIIEDHQGSVEFVENAFSNAERSSDVEIAIVRLQNKNVNMFNFDANFTDTDAKKESINFENFNEVMTNDIFMNNEIAFENCKNALTEFLQARRKLEHYSNMLFDTATSTHTENVTENDLRYSTRRILESALRDNSYSDKNKDAQLKEIYNETIDAMRKNAWKNIGDIPRIKNMLSETSLVAFRELLEIMSDKPYIASNMQQLYLTIIQNLPKMRTQAFVDAFDWLTKYYKDNRVFVEGWKTNDSWKVNKRCILPNSLEFSPYSYKKGELNLRINSSIRNLEKCLMYLDKPHLTETEIQEKLFNIHSVADYHGKHPETGKKLETYFFYVKFYQKGTVHLEFKDLRLLDIFNYIVCKDKNWLPQKDQKEYAKKYKKDPNIPNWLKFDLDILEESQPETLQIENTPEPILEGQLF